MDTEVGNEAFPGEIESYVDNNLDKLMRKFEMDCDTEEAKTILLDYFKRFSGRVRTFNLFTVGAPKGPGVPTTNNIGGTLRYL